MANHTLTHLATTAGTYYAYPLGQSLADWTTYRIQLVEGGSPNTGRYQGTADDQYGVIWCVFSGASQPSSWDVAVDTIDMSQFASQDRTWYVDDSATGLGTGLNRADAFTTVTAALSVVNSGDTIRIAAGTYSGAHTISVPGITLIGVGNGTIITHNDGKTLTLNANGLCLKQLKVIASAETNNGTAIYNNSAMNCLLEGVFADGKFAALDGIVPINQVCVDCIFNGTKYAVTGTTLISCKFARCYIQCSANHSVDGEFCGVRVISSIGGITNTTISVFEDCSIHISRSGTSAANYRTIGAILSGTTTLKNCRVTARATNVSYAGVTIGILGDDHVAGAPFAAGETTIFGGTVSQINVASVGQDYDLVTAHVDSTITVVGTTYSNSSMTGTLNDNAVAIAGVPSALLNTNRSTYASANTIGQAFKSLWKMFTDPAVDTGELSAAALDLVITPLSVVDANVDAIGTLLATVNTTVNTINGTTSVLPSAAAINSAVVAGTVGTDAANAAGFSFLVDQKIADLQTRSMHGSNLTVQAGSTVSSLVVVAEAGIVSANLDNAMIVTTTVGRVRAAVRVDSVTGTAPNLTLAVTPDLPDVPEVNDVFVVGPQYIDTGSL